jgi:Zn-dependent protease
MPGVDLDYFLYRLSVAIIPVLFAITVHEVAHGWSALKFGDTTAQRAGRLTLNPINHIDPVGTVAVPLMLLLLTGGSMMFGWAKPVPVMFQNLRNPRRDMIIVAAAGPASNLAMALGWALLAFFAAPVMGVDGAVADWVNAVCRWGIFINCILAVFNMLPIPPLDGGRVLAGLLPPQSAYFLSRIEPFGFMIVVLLMVAGVLWRLLEPFLLFFIDLFWTIAGFR